MTPQKLAMIASVVKAAAVMLAATCPPPRAPDAIMATAPMPRASVDRPTSAVSTPQMTKRMPSRSTCDLVNYAIVIGDADAELDAHGRSARRPHAKADARAVGDAGRHRHPHRPADRQRAAAAALVAALGPGFAASAARHARVANRHFDRHDEAVGCFAPGHLQFRAEQSVVGVLAEEGFANTIERRVDAREVDGN